MVPCFRRPIALPGLLGHPGSANAASCEAQERAQFAIRPQEPAVHLPIIQVGFVVCSDQDMHPSMCNTCS